MKLERRELLKAAALAAGAGLLQPTLLAQIGKRRDDFTGVRVQPIPRYGHATALLSQNRVLVIGGLTASGTLASCQIYDPEDDSLYDAAPLAQPRGQHSATRLRDGRIAVLGGYDGGALAITSLYDPVADTWERGKPLKIARYLHTAQALNDTRVVLTGGFSDGILAAAEVWEP